MTVDKSAGVIKNGRLMPTVAHVLIATLRAAGVARLFHVPGADAEILAAARAHDLPLIACRDESAACVMAAVTGSLTGVPGAALGAAGAPDASAAGLALAWANRSPMIFLSGDKVDLGDEANARVKASLPVTAESVSHWAAHAVHLALAEPRGPVHLSLSAAVGGDAALPLAVSVTPPMAPAPDAADIARAADLIRNARRPLVIAGLGCRGADTRWLRAFAESIPTPVLTTLRARGAIPDPHPLAMGTFTGDGSDHLLLDQADLVVAFGVDPLEVGPGRWPPAAPVVSLSRGPAIGRAAVHVTGDLATVLEEIAPRVVGRAGADWDVAWVDRVRRARWAAPVMAPGLSLHQVIQFAREITEAGAIATMDGHPDVAPAATAWQATDIGELLVGTGGSATPFGLPAAIAAQLCHPDRRVLCVASASSISDESELETLARLGLPIVVVAAGRPDGLDTRARACGIRFLVAESDGQAQRALLAGLAGPGPTLIGARTAVGL
jgi:acetolactate synthase I/II/III large subunit